MFKNLITYHIHKEEPLPTNNAQAYQYIVAGNGVFLRAENRFFKLLQPIATCQVRGLPALSPSLMLKVGKMPAFLLTQLIQNAQQPSQDNQLHEAQYLFYHQNNHIRLVKPPQQTSLATVVSPHQASTHILLDLHSHGIMSSFWSNTDNQDEQGFRAYGVIGNLRKQPEICLRLGVYGYWFPIPLTFLFHSVADVQDKYLTL